MKIYHKKTIRELRTEQYRYNSGVVPHINNWKRNPYTFLKARFYMEASAILVYFLLKTRIKPNTVTIIYGLVGILGCILLAIPTNTTHIIAILIFFTKGILDWSDGHFARITGQTSVTGHVLDVYGSLLNDLGFQMGLGFYVAFKTDIVMFYYLIPLIPFFYATRLKSFARAILFEEISKKGFFSNEIQKGTNIGTSGKTHENVKSGILGKYEKYSKYLSSFLDPRARSVDFICLLILLEIIFQINVTWIIFLLLLMKQLLIFIASFYIVGKGGWAENELNERIGKLMISIDNIKK